MQAAAKSESRNWRWWAEVHRLDRPVLVLTDALVGGMTRKTMGEPAGTFWLTVKPSYIPGYDGGNLFRFVADDDWVLIGATDSDGVDWVIMLGLVDSVRRQRTGTAAATTFTIQGRDLGKILLKTDLLDMPWLGMGLTDGLGNVAVAQMALNNIVERTPGRLVDGIMRYGLAAEEYRGPRRLWAVPDTIVFRPRPGEPVVDPAVRQASDIISREHIDPDTQGNMPVVISLPVGYGQGGGLWSIMTQFSNPLLNELHYDVIAVAGSTGAPTAYSSRGGDAGSFNTRPAVRLRQKPFPSIDDGDAWRRVPVSTFPETHLEAFDVGRSGAERFNWFAVEAGGGDDLTARGALAMIAGTVAPEDYWDSMPAVLQSSIERHGRLPLQQASMFLNPALTEQEVWIGQQWTRLLRDWYAPNPVFLSGTATIAYLAPGVRIGERLRVVMRDASVEEFYVESVENRFVKRPDGSAHGNTTLGVTRGWQLEDANADYTAEVQSWLRENLEVMA